MSVNCSASPAKASQDTVATASGTQNLLSKGFTTQALIGELPKDIVLEVSDELEVQNQVEELKKEKEEEK